MPTDFLTSLNSGGSGLNISELAQVLTDAEINPRRNLVTDRIDQAELRLSGYAQLRAQADQVNAALNFVAELSPYAITSSSDGVNAEITDASLLSPDTADLEVTQLARAQVLNFGGFNDPTTALGAGDITVSFGTWSQGGSPTFTANSKPAQTLQLQSDATLNDLATALGSIEGISARVIDVGDGTYTLGVISETGADNALNLTVGAGSSAALQAFDISADPTNVQAQDAQNAELRLNGIPVTRSTNEIDDLIAGVRLSLTSTTPTPATVSTFPNSDGALEVMQGLVDILNATVFLVSSLTDSGVISGGEAGALAGESLADRFLAQFQSTLAKGFGETEDAGNTFLADIGILTERDGTYSLDDDRFMAAVEADALVLAPLLRDTLVADGATITGSPSGTDLAAGAYRFERDIASGAASLAGRPLFGSEQSDGTWQYTAVTGPFQGVSITVSASLEETSVNFAPSLVSTLQAQIDEFTSSGGALAARDASLQDAITDEEIALDALDRRAEEIEARYLTRFTQMEQIITQLNSTGELLQSIIDAQNADN